MGSGGSGMAEARLKPLSHPSFFPPFPAAAAPTRGEPRGNPGTSALLAARAQGQGRPRRRTRG